MKRCTLGLKCPYVGQRQHTQEYFHEALKGPVKAAKAPKAAKAVAPAKPVLSDHQRVEAEAKARNTILTAAEKRTTLVEPTVRPSRVAKTQANKRIEDIQSGIDIVTAPAATTVKAIKKLRTVPPIEEAPTGTIVTTGFTSEIDDQEME